VAVGIAEAVARAAAEVAVDPADPLARRFDRLDAPLERRRADRAPRDATHPRPGGGGQLERARRMVAVPAQVDGLPVDVHDLHAEHVLEVPQAPVELGGEQLDAAEMRDVLDPFGGRGHGKSPRARPPGRVQRPTYSAPGEGALTWIKPRRRPRAMA